LGIFTHPHVFPIQKTKQKTKNKNRDVRKNESPTIQLHRTKIQVPNILYSLTSSLMLYRTNKAMLILKV